MIWSLGTRCVFFLVFSRTSERREVGVTSRSCRNLQHFSFWTRKMRLVPRFSGRKCASYCKMQAKVLLWTCLKLTPRSRFVPKLPTRTARARSFYVFRAGSQVRPETPAELWSQWTFKHSLGLRQAALDSCGCSSNRMLWEPNVIDLAAVHAPRTGCF